MRPLQRGLLVIALFPTHRYHLLRQRALLYPVLPLTPSLLLTLVGIQVVTTIPIPVVIPMNFRLYLR